MEAKQFFPEVRRAVSIMDFHVLKSSGKELRIKVTTRMKIGGGIPMQSVPEWVLEGYQAVVKDKAVHRKILCELEIDGVAIDTFTTPDVKRKTQSWLGCDIKQFTIERIGKDEKAGVYLGFVIYTKYVISQDSDKDLLIWLAKHMHEDSYFSFDATQASFQYPGEEAEKGDNKQDGLFDNGESEGDAEEREAEAEEADNADPRTSPKASRRKK